MSNTVTQTATTTHGSFTFADWDEQPVTEVEGGPKVARATVTNTYTGRIEGVGKAIYVMVYVTEGVGRYTGWEQITGTLDGRSGSFVLRQEGEFEGETVNCRWSIVPGSGTGELAEAEAEGGFVSTGGAPATPYTIEPVFPGAPA
ncbi:DUF3224 domain-containing protein [Allostreptomyces psammosilenae]|uniref:DUF3224 domain-containing protein n=1 Tax=Allostreptomyces psammosilenae TaxID=1892865 RepID=A0A852ZYD2_9ACTN|nr:DUF3224 domain-containing protein [Allostreptomyces psammosilenae]NYI06817.1 hypothetical protein [Allostreptomyces psammosilenae]